jgi:acetyl-CoA carboxylase biotin carboxyl carrier protein
MIDLDIVEKLLDLLSQSDADKIEVRDGDTSIKVSRNSGGAVSYQMTAPAPSVPTAPSAAAAAEPQSGGDAVVASGPADNLVEIASPMVGTFYAQSEPGADPYVRVGDRISIGQTLCIIEAMKIMNTLDAEVSGVLREICVSDATPVEFGQALFRVDPNG